MLPKSPLLWAHCAGQDAAMTGTLAAVVTSSGTDASLRSARYSLFTSKRRAEEPTRNEDGKNDEGVDESTPQSPLGMHMAATTHASYRI